MPGRTPCFFMAAASPGMSGKIACDILAMTWASRRGSLNLGDIVCAANKWRGNGIYFNGPQC
jgi:hypothetical protein